FNSAGAGLHRCWSSLGGPSQARPFDGLGLVWVQGRAVAQWATRDAQYLGVVEAARRAAARDTVSARSTPDPGIAFAATLDAGGAAYDMVQASLWDRRLRAGIRGVRSVVQQAAWSARHDDDQDRTGRRNEGLFERARSEARRSVPRI